MGCTVGGNKKIGMSRWVLLVLLMLSTMAFSWGKKSSSVEGKLVDWNNKPVAGVNITAYQMKWVKGYERFEAVTGSDGSFVLKGLFPSSAYLLKPWSDKWTTEAWALVDSAPHGETAVLPKPLKIDFAFRRDGSIYTGLRTLDLAPRGDRFEISSDWMITDTQTKLEWVMSLDIHNDYAKAKQWVAECQIAGGGWRMPTMVELKTLYQRGVGDIRMDPALTSVGCFVWAEPRDSSSAWGFSFFLGTEEWKNRDASLYNRVYGVRSHLR